MSNMDEFKTVTDKKSQRTLCFISTVFLIMLLQNGYLHNIPIVLIILPFLFFGSRYSLRMGKNERNVLIYGFYLIATTVVFFSDNFDRNYTTNIILQYLIIFFSIHFEMQKMDIRKILIYFRNAGIVLSPLCILEAVIKRHFLANILGKKFEYNIFRVISIFDHPIVCGSFLVMFLCLMIVFPLKNRQNQIIVVMITALAIILTRSRSAWLASAFISFVYYMKLGYKKINRKYAFYLLILFFVLLLAGSGLGYNIVKEFTQFIYSRFHGMLEAGEGHIVRIEIILSSLEYWRRNPVNFIFGRGKNYGLFFMKEHPVQKFGTFTWDAAIDNQYVTLIHETGVIGFSVIMAIIVIVLRRFIKASKSNKEQLAADLCLLGNAVCLFFFEGFNYPVLVLMYLILIIISDKFENGRG